MADPPLIVDPQRLEAAASKLGEIALPELPPAVPVTGSDSVSQAVNEIMPLIEAPAAATLPKLGAAVGRSAENVLAAARAYAEADSGLGKLIDQDTSIADLDRGGGGAPRVGIARSTAPLTDSAPAAPASESGSAPRQSHVATRVDEVASAAGVVGVAVQGAQQGVQQGVQQVVQLISQGAHGAARAAAPAGTEHETVAPDAAAGAGAVPDGAPVSSRAAEQTPTPPASAAES